MDWNQTILTEAMIGIERLFRKGHFQVVDQALTYLRAEAIPSEVLLGILPCQRVSPLSTRFPS